MDRCFVAIGMILLVVATAHANPGVCTVGADSDGDFILDENDNCCVVFNPSEIDTDADGYGNACDADYNNDGAVNFADLTLFKGAFSSSNPLFDCNNDGIVNFPDLGCLKKQFFGSPGPSCIDLPVALQGPTCP